MDYQTLGCAKHPWELEGKAGYLQFLLVVFLFINVDFVGQCLLVGWKLIISTSLDSSMPIRLTARFKEEEEKKGKTHLI